MSNTEEADFDDDGMDGDPMDTGLFDADQIVSEFESQTASDGAGAGVSAWQRVENLLERKRLKESLRDLYDDDFLDDEYS